MTCGAARPSAPTVSHPDGHLRRKIGPRDRNDRLRRGQLKASYNADGQMTEQLLPDGLAQKIGYDPGGTATSLKYVKESYCSSNCTWLEFNREDSSGGQMLRETSTFAT